MTRTAQVGGGDGAGRFTQSEAFRALNVGVALDEGLASPTEAFTVFYGERAPWFLTSAFHAHERAGPHNGLTSSFLSRTLISHTHS